jgi:hypothetical protein
MSSTPAEPAGRTPGAVVTGPSADPEEAGDR